MWYTVVLALKGICQEACNPYTSDSILILNCLDQENLRYIYFKISKSRKLS